MKLATLYWIMLSVAVAAAADAPVLRSPDKDVVRVATALEHLTVLEFGEPIVLVAAGGRSFQIERHDDKVFIKPLASGMSTDLIVWTASRRLVYELEAPGEVRDMNFVLDNRIPPGPPPAARVLEETVDFTLANAFLAARPIDSSAVRDRRRGVTVRVEHVLLSKSRVYLHYSVRNLGKRPYRLETPTVARLLASAPPVSGPPLRETQLGERSLGALGAAGEVALEVQSVHAPGGELLAGQKAEGVICLDRPLAAAVLQLVFAPDRGRRVQAMVVL